MGLSVAACLPPVRAGVKGGFLGRRALKLDPGTLTGGFWERNVRNVRNARG